DTGRTGYWCRLHARHARARHARAGARVGGVSSGRSRATHGARSQSRRRAGALAGYSSTTSVSPSLTAWPSSQRISATVPESSASTGISIFIDSRIATVSPSSTESPTAHSIFHTVPVIWASMSITPTSKLRSPLAPADNSPRGRRPMASHTLVIVTARNEGKRIGATLAALASALPDAPLLVADDGSTDATAA